MSQESATPMPTLGFTISVIRSDDAGQALPVRMPIYRQLFLNVNQGDAKACLDHFLGLFNDPGIRQQSELIVANVLRAHSQEHLEMLESQRQEDLQQALNKGTPP